jgi:import receptor subunit TOM22
LDTNNDIESDAVSIASSVGEETLLDRLHALQDIIPPKQRLFLQSTYQTASSWTGSALSFSGKALWVISTSVLLVGLPFVLALSDDQIMAEEERRMQLQSTASEFLTPGGADGERSGAGL